MHIRNVVEGTAAMQILTWLLLQKTLGDEQSTGVYVGPTYQVTSSSPLF